MKQKTPNDVRGVQEKCINYQACPLCYGCRNYRINDPECGKCKTYAKRNICNTDTHRADLIDKMITKNVIMLEGNIKFSSKK